MVLYVSMRLCIVGTFSITLFHVKYPHQFILSGTYRAVTLARLFLLSAQYAVCMYDTTSIPSIPILPVSFVLPSLRPSSWVGLRFDVGQLTSLEW